MKKMEISKEEYNLIKRIDKRKCLKHFNKYFFIYDNINQLKLMKYLVCREVKENCR